jgi:hypothetical protein
MIKNESKILKEKIKIKTNAINTRQVELLNLCSKVKYIF